MTQGLTADVFNQSIRYLRVWFSSDNITFNQLTPDTRIAAVPYALQAQEAVEADTVDGLHASELKTHYQNVVVVAKSGGDYTSVQAAIDSITDAESNNHYLVWVAPGMYEEQVTMKPYVHLQGAGQEVTVIWSNASSSAWPPDAATLVLASDTSLRDLTVSNFGTGENNTALLATAGIMRTLVADVTAWALGSGVNNQAIFLSGYGTGVTLQQMTALAKNGSDLNSGLINFGGAAAVLRGGNYTSRGGTRAWAIFNAYTATLEAESVTVLGENGSNLNHGLFNYNNSTAVLYGGDYTGRGGNQTGGVSTQLNSTITAYNVTALAENGSGDVGNYGMGCYDNSTATLSGGVFIARGGVNNYALSNELTVTMRAENVTSLAENGSNSNYGLWNVNSAEATVIGGSFTGRAGVDAYGIYNSGSGTTLETEGVTVLGENGSHFNRGLYNCTGAAATLRGGSFTGRGGGDPFGIGNSGGTLDAESVTTLAEDGSGTNYGLHNYDGATALRGGSYIARGGSNAWGIINSDSNATLKAESVTALGENGSSYNFGLYNYNDATANVTQSVLEGATNSVSHFSGSVTVSNGRLVGGAVSGAVTCVLVTRGTTISTDGSCP
jgi:hypothetical protein